MNLILAAAVVTTLVAAPTQPVSIEFLRLHDTNAAGVGREETETQIRGVEAGFSEANAFLIVERKEVPMYCQPPELSFTGPQLVEVLRHGIAENRKFGEFPLDSALFEIMRKKFPCPENSN